jgi:hypothetical protein
MGKALSSKQAALSLRIIANHKQRLVKKHSIDPLIIDHVLARPSYRLPPYESIVIVPEVRYVGDNKLAIRCPSTDMFKNDIQTIRRKLENHQPSECIAWNASIKGWIIPVNRHTINKIIEMISENNLGFDDLVAEYLTVSTNSLNHPSTIAFDETNNIIVANICDNEEIAMCFKNVFGASFA